IQSGRQYKLNLIGSGNQQTFVNRFSAQIAYVKFFKTKTVVKPNCVLRRIWIQNKAVKIEFVHGNKLTHRIKNHLAQRWVVYLVKNNFLGLFESNLYTFYPTIVFCQNSIQTVVVHSKDFTVISIVGKNI